MLTAVISNSCRIQTTPHIDVIKLSKLYSVDEILYAYSLRRFFIIELRDLQKNLDIDMLSCVLSTEKEHGIAAHMLEDTRVFEP